MRAHQAIHCSARMQTMVTFSPISTEPFRPSALLNESCREWKLQFFPDCRCAKLAKNIGQPDKCFNFGRKTSVALAQSGHCTNASTRGRTDLAPMLDLECVNWC
ncbi:unnamed protein product [Ixodes pacificus]